MLAAFGNIVLPNFGRAAEGNGGARFLDGNLDTAILRLPDFSHTDTTWHFFLITSEYDDSVEARISQSGRARGIAQEGDGYTLWVKTWAEVLRESDARHQFIQDKLKIEVSDADIEARINELTKAVIKA